MTETAMEVATRATAEVEPILSQAIAGAPVMTDDEIQRTFRVAKALAASSLYKDVTSAEQGFAKLLIGRTLGLNEHQSLSLYVMEGGIEVPYQMLGQFVRAREGYDYRPAWLKESLVAIVPVVKSGPNDVDEDKTGEVVSVGEDPRHGKVYTVRFESGNTARLLDSEIKLMTKERVLVWLDEDDPADNREIVGAVIEFTIDGKVRGSSRWTVEDTIRANLDADRGSKTSNHVKYPRNMYLARSMSNGAKWLVPEVIAGLPVYTLGELPRKDDLGAGEGDGKEPGWGDVAVAAAHEVERLIRRAEKVSYPSLADRGVWQMKLRGQPDAVVARIIQEAADELAGIEGSLISTAVDESEPDGGGIASESRTAADGPTEDSGSAPGAPPPSESPDAEHQELERGETSPGSSAPAPSPDREELQNQLAAAREGGDADAVADLEAQLDALPGPDDGDQIPLV